MSERSNWWGLFLVFVLAGGGLAAPSLANLDDNAGWEYRVQAAFAPLSIDGRATVNGHSASFVTGSSDLMGFDTNGIKIRLEAWREHWGITADNTIANFSAESRIDSANTVNLDGHDYNTELGVNYRLGSERLIYEAMAGARFVALKQELDYSSGVHESDKKRYVDPLVGARVTWIMTNLLSVDVRGNVGGFGIGSASELTWMVIPELNIHLSKSILVNLGYRHHDIRTEEEGGDTSTQFDGRVYGPFLGIEVRFTEPSSGGEKP
ncbi:MAG: hypothetical protein KCHDKBKB_01315 [Elusimicrobia bacterium]|nr:hypothetical protein [Elusimicrobiota bacterium]